MRFFVVLSNVVERIICAKLRGPHFDGNHSVKERLRRQSARLIDGFVEHRTWGTFTAPYRCCKATRKCGCVSRCCAVATCRAAVLPMQWGRVVLARMVLLYTSSACVDWIECPLHTAAACRNEAAARSSSAVSPCMQRAASQERLRCVRPSNELPPVSYTHLTLPTKA